MHLKEYFKQTDTLDKILFASFFSSSALFLGLLIPFHPYPLSYLLKSIPMFSLFLLLIKNVRNRQGILFSIGIIFSMCGDITLDLDRNRLFIFGLIFFLIAHIFYCFVFLTVFNIKIRPVLYTIPVILYAVILGILFSSIPLAQRIPVMIYLTVISLMTALSLFTPFNMRIVFTGALLFMLSDTIIAINKFFHPIPYSTFFNIILYMIAQFLLVASILVFYTKLKS